MTTDQNSPSPNGENANADGLPPRQVRMGKPRPEYSTAIEGDVKSFHKGDVSWRKGDVEDEWKGEDDF